MDKLINYLKILFHILVLLLIILSLYPGSILGFLIYGDFKLQPKITEDFLNITLIECIPAISTFQDTAEAISKVDLVVSIDSAVIHLTGAMGKPGIVLLNYAADWRWGNGFGTAPWYPSIQMFRQVVPGNWKTVFDQVSTFIKHTYLP